MNDPLGRPIPKGPPPPESWGWELELLIGNLQDRLDLFKQYGCLTISVDVAHLIPRRSTQFIRCVNLGSQVLADVLSQRFTCDLGKPLSAFQTPTLMAMTQACCLDDINLDHVFCLLRLIELLENCQMALSPGLHAQIVCAVLGELELVASDLDSGIGGIANDTNESRAQCSTLLHATQKQFIDLICESGRDRAAYLKDIFCRIPISGPRPRFCDASVLTAFRSDATLSGAIHKGQMSMYSLNANGDPTLQNLLMRGSLLSMWNRLQSLWTTLDPTRKTGKESKNDELLRVSSVVERIRWAVFHSVVEMPRHRRLIFTRFLQALCSPIFITPPSHLYSNIASPTYLPSQLVRMVVDAFLDTKITLWPYESDAQLESIDKTPTLPDNIKRQLKSIICVPDSIIFCTQQDELEEEGKEWIPRVSSGVTFPSLGRRNLFQNQVDHEKFKRAAAWRYDVAQTVKREKMETLV